MSRGMFDSYEDLANSYSPNNLSCGRPKPDCGPIKPADPNKPYTDYDEEGNITGYFWHYGDTINLEFTIDGQMTTDSEYINAKEFLINKYAHFKLYDFRKECVYQLTTEAYDGTKDTVLIEIDSELSKKLVRGVYYCSLSITDGGSYYQTLIGTGSVPSIQFTVR